MSSNLACIGADVRSETELDHLLARVIGEATVIGERRGARVLRWQDVDGARLLITMSRRGECVGFTPSFAGAPGAMLGGLRHCHGDLWQAAVLESGEQVAALAADVEQHLLLDQPAADAVPASVIALGGRVSLFVDAEEHGRSSVSLLDPDADPDAASADGRGPLRFAAESFLPGGLFVTDQAQVTADAMLAGTVLSSRTCRNSLTGQAFHVARVRTVGFEVDLCLSAAEHPVPPVVGSVVAGEVYLVVDLPVLPRRRRRFGRREQSPSLKS